jgi:polysaccharide export outer membrane protein
LVSICFFSSCTSTKDSYYFKTLKKDTTLNGFVTNNFESKIQKGDVLAINISSLSKDEDAFFNSGAALATEGSAAGYPVSERGTILLHKLGMVSVAGLTRKALQNKLQQYLLPYLKDPIVTVQYVNHKVTIMGDVGKPQIIPLPEEQISVIDALVLSGDVKDDAKKNNIMIIREHGDTKQVKHINLEDHSIFSSSWYYLKPNDIVYVEPDFEKTKKEENRRKLQTTLSLVASFTSLIIIILDRIIK